MQHKILSLHSNISVDIRSARQSGPLQLRVQPRGYIVPGGRETISGGHCYERSGKEGGCLGNLQQDLNFSCLSREDSWTAVSMLFYIHTGTSWSPSSIPEDVDDHPQVSPESGESGNISHDGRLLLA